MEELDVSQQDANESTESSVPSDSQTGELESAIEAKPAQESESDRFDKHPRFQELINNSKAAKEQLEQYRSMVESLNSRLAEFEQRSQPAKANPLLDRLKGIDPEFGESYADLNSKASKLEQIEQQLRDMELNRVAEQYQSQVKQLFTENKVPESLQKRYDREIKAIAAENPNLGLKDLPQVFKGVHEEYTKLLEDMRREERKSYGKDLKTDMKTPRTQPKGQTAKGTSAKKAVSREEMIQSIASKALAGSVADSDI